MLNSYLKKALFMVILGSMALPVQAAGKGKAPDMALKVLVKQINIPTGEEVTSISKTLKGKLGKSNEVHIYVVCTTVPGSFSAMLAKYPVESQLSLFDQGGFGILSHRELGNNSLATNASGLMYLAISNSGNAPMSEQGEIFEASGQPSENGGSWPVVDWTRQGNGKGAYELSVTGLSPLNRCPSIEPSIEEEEG